MPHTREQRDQVPLCGAKRRSGEPCRLYAGHGTSHKGTGRCKLHGGATPNHEKAAVTLEARRNMVALGAPLPDVHPHQALLGMLRAGAGHVSYLHAEVSRLEDVTTHRAKVLIELYDAERDRLTKVAAACLAGGVSEHEVKLSIETADAVAEPIIAALNSIGGLTVEQRAQFAQALRLELAAAADAWREPVEDPGAIYRPASAA